ncbi:MAG TPA: diguanylate cyclase [Longimicrobium sp.]|jgi:diguanylate cyclase (GGDEF)-like protein|uniref:tetratricopeptide repeat-containing diguanylate cyclase n=1 Tax=Longimicrobium sp. TaxID=2029185 RepID=UPI002EDB62D6
MLVDPNESGVLSDSLPPAPEANSRARVDALADEAWSIRLTDRERANSLACQALELAEVEGYGVGIALALRTLGVQRNYFVSDYEGALILLQRALSLLDAEGETRGRGDVLSGIGYVHLRRGEYAQATHLHLQALQIQRATGDVVGEANSLNHLGVVASRAGEHGAALEYYQASLTIRELHGDRAAVGHSLMNIGATYGHLGEMERLLEYSTRALQIHEHSDLPAAGVCLNNIGTAFLALGEYNLALEYLEQAAAGFRAIGHVDEASCLCEVGCVHQARGDDAAALSCFLQGLNLMRRLGSRVYEPEILMRLGHLEERLGDAAGLAHLHEALGLAEAQGAREYVYAAHEALAEAYERNGDTARALLHHRAFHKVWREVFSTETNRRIQNVRVRAEVQQTQREAEILREKNEALTRADEEKARLLEQLRTQAAELERQTREDGLTGVFNRRHLDTLLAVEWERALRFGRSLTVAMLDVDHFKAVNDRFSHAAGDEVLRTVARILRENTRGVDVVARYGGEEFCLILVEAGVDEGARLCDRLRALVQAHDWSAIRTGLAVTVSIGVAGLHEAEAPGALLAAADLRLYAAKHAGRNRVCAG